MVLLDETLDANCIMFMFYILFDRVYGNGLG